MAAATVVPGLAAAGALLFTAISVQQAQDNLNVTQQGQITDRYNDAVTNLGSDSEDIRLGGIYALQRIMNDSPRDQPPIVQVLAAYIRGHSPEQKPPRSPKHLGNDIRAALSVLRDRNSHRDDARTHIDLADTHLHNADLNGASLNTADLSSTVMTGADLEGSSLDHADLNSADLSGADLREATLTAARLDDANLTNANLTNADLSNGYLFTADLHVAYLNGADLSNANLEWANLSGALLIGALLNGADLHSADLSGADLRHADLKGVHGLTVKQVLTAYISARTALPPHIASDPRVQDRRTLQAPGRPRLSASRSQIAVP